MFFSAPKEHRRPFQMRITVNSMFSEIGIQMLLIPLGVNSENAIFSRLGYCFIVQFKFFSTTFTSKILNLLFEFTFQTSKVQTVPSWQKTS